MMKYVFEGCCTSAESAFKARVAGATRVELCTQLEVGGLTPDRDTVREALEVLNCRISDQNTLLTKMFHLETLKLNPLFINNITPKLNILVRPRSGDFVFDENETKQMISDLEWIKKCTFHTSDGRCIGVNGAVIGALRRDGSVDIETMRRLIDAARPLEVTFHRAFDECADPASALEDIIPLGCERLLTSGHEANAFTGRYTLSRLVKQASGRIIILAGCGVRPHNIDEIARVSHAPEYHSSILDGWDFTDNWMH